MDEIGGSDLRRSAAHCRTSLMSGANIRLNLAEAAIGFVPSYLFRLDGGRRQDLEESNFLKPVGRPRAR